MENFYCIMIVNDISEVGYISEENDKPIVLTGDFIYKIKMFKHFSEAGDYIRNKEIEANGARTYIKDQSDIEKQLGPEKFACLFDEKNKFHSFLRQAVYINYSTIDLSYHKGPVFNLKKFDLSEF